MQILKCMNNNYDAEIESLALRGGEIWGMGREASSHPPDGANAIHCCYAHMKMVDG
jgi:hypothetical protein